MAYTESIAKEELKYTTPITFVKISPKELPKTVEKTHTVLKDKVEVSNKVNELLKS